MSKALDRALEFLDRAIVELGLVAAGETDGADENVEVES